MPQACALLDFHYVFQKWCLVFISDYAMPMDTVVVGDERGSFDFVHKSGNDSRIICSKKGNVEAVALVFAQDRDRSLGMSCYFFGSPC